MAGVISTLWREQLPKEVRTQVANHSIQGKETMKATLLLADSVYASLNQPQQVAIVQQVTVPAAPPVASGGAIPRNSPNLNLSADEPALQVPVAAYTRGRGARNNRGGRWQQRGGQQRSNPRPQPQQQRGQNKPEDRHSDNPPEGSCYAHWRFGKSATFCRFPFTCPWASIIAREPAKN